jgi:hypothetical protein
MGLGWMAVKGWVMVARDFMWNPPCLLDDLCTLTLYVQKLGEAREIFGIFSRGDFDHAGIAVRDPQATAWAQWGRGDHS